MKCYVAYFDCLGFECILNFSDYSKKAMWDSLQDKNYRRFPLNEMILRASLNPQRSPEIWSFWSDLNISVLRKYSKEIPQELADLIRKNGSALYTSVKEKRVIE